MYIIKGNKIDTLERFKSIQLLILIIAVAIGAVLYFHKFPISIHPDLLPQCPWHYLTGTYCPGCGTLRGISGIINGNITTLPRNNIFSTIIILYLIYYFIKITIKAIFSYKLPEIIFNKYESYGILVLIILFWIIRNFIPILAPIPVN